MPGIPKLNQFFNYLEKVQKALRRELISLSPFLFKSTQIKPKTLLSRPIYNVSHFDDPDHILKTPAKKAYEKWGGAGLDFYNYDEKITKISQDFLSKSRS